MKNSPFFDDQLFEFVRTFPIEDKTSINLLIQGLYRRCEQYLTDNLEVQDPLPVTFATVNRVFNCWDSAIKRLEESSNESHRLRAKLIKCYKSFKEIYFSEPEKLHIYDKLKEKVL